LLLIVLIIVLLFYICQCAKEQFDGFKPNTNTPSKKPTTRVSSRPDNIRSGNTHDKNSPQALRQEQKERNKKLNQRDIDDAAATARTFDACVGMKGENWCRFNWDSYYSDY
jgi:hypothetical protein